MLFCPKSPKIGLIRDYSRNDFGVEKYLLEPVNSMAHL